MVTWRGYILMGATAGLVAAAISLAVVYLLGPRMSPLPQQQPPAQQAEQGPVAPTPFPDFGYAPPADQYKGPLFRLRQNYPDTKEGAKPPDFLNIPFNENAKEQNWLKYLLAVRAYCFEGNVDVDWDVSKNEVRGWYHAGAAHLNSFCYNALSNMFSAGEAPA